MRVATPVAGMPFAEVKGAGAWGKESSQHLSLGIPPAPVYPQGWHQPLLPPRPRSSGFRGGPVTPAHGTGDPPSPGKGHRSTQQWGTAMAPHGPLVGHSHGACSPTVLILKPILAPESPAPPPQCSSSTPQIHPWPMESAPNPTVLILNLREPSLLHRAHLQLLHSPKNLSGSTQPCRAVLGTACLDDLLGEPLLPPAARPAQHHAQIIPRAARLVKPVVQDLPRR